MRSIDFDNVISPDPLIDGDIQYDIQLILTGRRKVGKELNIIQDLKDFQDSLVFKYTEKNMVRSGYSPEQTANIVFSQFLQYLGSHPLK